MSSLETAEANPIPMSGSDQVDNAASPRSLKCGTQGERVELTNDVLKSRIEALVNGCNSALRETKALTDVFVSTTLKNYKKTKSDDKRHNSLLRLQIA